MVEVKIPLQLGVVGQLRIETQMLKEVQGDEGLYDDPVPEVR